MIPASKTIHQNFIDEDIEPITVQPIHESQLTDEILDAFLDNSPNPLGIASAYSESGSHLVVLAIAHESNVLLVEFYSSKPSREGRGKSGSTPKIRDRTGRSLLQDKLLCRPLGDIFAFDLAPLALSLYQDHGLRLTNGVDIQSAGSEVDRQPLASIKLALGDSLAIYDDNVRGAFENTIYNSKRTSDIAIRAWISQYLPQLGTMEDLYAKAKRIDTQSLTSGVSGFFRDFQYPVR